MDAENYRFLPDDIRVSDADRDLAVTELSEHFQTGRLTQDEFEDRSSRALQARTGADLGALFTDLPRQSVARVPQAPPALDGGDVSRPGQHRPMPTARLMVAFVVVAIVAANIVDQGNAGFGWLVPVIIFALLFLRPHHHHRR
jgi:Domain of unknown function (DUF1707)